MVDGVTVGMVPSGWTRCQIPCLIPCAIHRRPVIPHTNS